MKAPSFTAEMRRTQRAAEEGTVKRAIEFVQGALCLIGVALFFVVFCVVVLVAGLISLPVGFIAVVILWLLSLRSSASSAVKPTKEATR